ncbi:hypothetical protein [Streptomyces olivaceoviridis]
MTEWERRRSATRQAAYRLPEEDLGSTGPLLNCRCATGLNLLAASTAAL